MSPRPRPPAVAGQFYEATGAALAHQLEECFLSPRGPGELPSRHRTPDRRIRAMVVPHAGYIYSGPIAALAYRAVAGERPPDSVLILGVDHHGRSRGAALSGVPWETPLGPTAIADDLLHSLEHSPLAIDEEAHSAEHSIEVQLPFLEYVVPQPRFVPLELGFDDFRSLHEVARVVRQAVTGHDTLLIASTDFSHYVPAPVAQQLDRLAIDAILARDARRLFDTVRSHHISMCGVAPTTVLLDALAGESLTARLLRWGHSGEASPMAEVVGYASLLLETPPTASPPVK